MASPTTWNRLSYAVVGLLLLAGFLLAGLWYLPEIRANQQLQQRKLELQGRLAAADTLLWQLKERVRELETNPKAVERLAREKLGYARPGETVIYFVPPLEDDTQSGRAE